MRVAVIGANGQLGNDLAKIYDKEAMLFFHKDLDVSLPNTLDVLAGKKPEVILNTAAFHKTDACEDDPAKTFMINSVGAKNIAELSNNIGAVNVYISTDYVFDGKTDIPYNEDDKPNPINVYGASKYAGELITSNYSNRYYIFRVSSLFGIAGASGKGGNFVETMISKAERKEEIKVIDDVFMSPTYTKDAAAMIKTVLDNDLSFGVYHITNDGYCSWYEFTREIFNLTKLKPEIKAIKSRDTQTKAKRPKFSALENRNLGNSGLEMKSWKIALKEYLIEKKHV